MGLLSRTSTFVRYSVEGQLPDNFWDFAAERIAQFSFQDIDDTFDESSMGWVAVDKVTVQVDAGDANAAVLEDGAEALLALPQRLFGQGALTRLHGHLNGDRLFVSAQSLALEDIEDVDIGDHFLVGAGRRTDQRRRFDIGIDDKGEVALDRMQIREFERLAGLGGLGARLGNSLNCSGTGREIQAKTGPDSGSTRAARKESHVAPGH